MMSLDQNKISHSKDIIEATKYEIMFINHYVYKVINRVYLSFKLDSYLAVSQMKYGNKYN